MVKAGVCYYKSVNNYSIATKRIMQLMEFIVGLWVGIGAGFILRGLVDKLEIELRHFGSKHGSKTKH